MNVSSYSQTVLQQRSQVVGLAIKYGAAFGFREDCMYDGLQLFDKVLYVLKCWTGARGTYSCVCVRVCVRA